MTELLLGPYRTGKTTYLIEKLCLFKKENPFSSALVLVPSARYASLFKERLAKELHKNSHYISGIMGLEISPFYSACTKIVQNLGTAKPILADELRSLVMSTVFNKMQNRGELQELSPLIHLPGTVASCLELIDEFQKAGYDPDELWDKLNSNTTCKPRFLELALCYKHYYEELDQLSFSEQKQTALRCRDILFDNTLSKSIKKIDLLVIDGFDRVSHLQAQIFSGLAKICPGNKAWLTFDYIAEHSNENKDLNSRQTIKNLSQSAEDYRWKRSSFKELIENLKPNIQYFPIRTEELNSLSLPSSQARSKQIAKQINIKLSSSNDPYFEMLEIARNCKEAIIERKVQLSEILVLVRAIDNYESAIVAAFKEARLPFFIDGSISADTLKVWQFIKELLSLPLLTKNKKNSIAFERQALIDVLLSPNFNLHTSQLSKEDILLIEKESYAHKLLGGIESWQKMLETKKPLLSLNQRFCQLLNDLNPSSEKKTIREHCTWIENLIDKFMIFSAEKIAPGSFLDACERGSLDILRRTLRLLLLQNDLFQLGQETYEEFFKRFEQLTEKITIARYIPKEEAIRVCSAELAPNKSYTEIYLAGLVEGNFPRFHKTSGFLAKNELDIWHNYGIDLRNPRAHPTYERSLFYSIAERSYNNFYCSYPQYELNGEELISSFYLEELKEKSDLTITKVSPYSLSFKKPLSARDCLASILFHYNQDSFKQLRNISSIFKTEAYSNELKLLSDEILLKQRAVYARFPTEQADSANDFQNLFNGYLYDFFKSNTYNFSDNDFIWTASKFNAFGKCPFRFYLQEILSFEPREEIKAGLNPILAGQCYHKILELFFSELVTYGPEKRYDPNLSKQILENALSRSFKWLESKEEFLPSIYWEQEKKNIRFRINRFIKAELERLSSDPEECFPAMFEVSFGSSTSQSFPTLRILRQNGKDISIKGMIDRIDLAPESSSSTKSVKLVDYKTSSASISLNESERGRNMQLAIYTLATENSILKNNKVQEARYLSINAAKTVGKFNYETEKHINLLATTKNLINTIVDSVESGVFTVAPNGKDVCENCSHRTVCRIAELNTPPIHPFFIKEN